MVGRGRWESKGEDFFCIGAARKPRVSFSFWRVAADRSRTGVQRGSASTRHLRKIAALFSRNSPAPMAKEILCTTSCGRRARQGILLKGLAATVGGGRGERKAPKEWQGGVVGRGWCEEQPHGRTRTNTDKHGRTRTVGG